MRRQLGVATQLFIDNLDPISIHCLVSSAAENASLMATEAGKPTFNQHILMTSPERQLKDIRKLRNQFWIPIKHSKENCSDQPIDLENAFDGFSDQINDHVLYVVWHDYLSAGLALPLEVQIFQIWYYGLYPDKMITDEGPAASMKVFGELRGLGRVEQKKRLKTVIEDFRKNEMLLGDPRTDSRSLVLP